MVVGLDAMMVGLVAEVVGFLFVMEWNRNNFLFNSRQKILDHPTQPRTPDMMLLTV